MVWPMDVGIFEAVLWTNVWGSAFSSRDHTAWQNMMRMDYTDRVERNDGVLMGPEMALPSMIATRSPRLPRAEERYLRSRPIW